MKCVNMATNLDINAILLNEALLIGGQKSKKDTVNKALEEFINKRKQREIETLFGDVVYSLDYDYKKSRGAR